MEYWRGYVNWPLDPNWSCKTCGGRTLIWGIQHGVCRCDDCHTQYTMQENDKRITQPKCLLKPEYQEPAQAGWKYYHKPISQWHDEMWDFAFSMCAE